MKRYKDVLVFVGTLIIVGFIWLVFGPQPVSFIANLMPILLLAPKVLKLNSKEPQKKIILIQATTIVVLVGLTLSQTFSLGPVPILISLLIGAVLLSISLRIKKSTSSEIIES